MATASSPAIGHANFGSTPGWENTMSWENTMKHFITALGAAIATTLIIPAAAQSLSKDIAERIEALSDPDADHIR